MSDTKIPGYVYCAEHDIFYSKKLLWESVAREKERQKKYPDYPPFNIPACPFCKERALRQL